MLFDEKAMRQTFIDMKIDSNRVGKIAGNISVTLIVCMYIIVIFEIKIFFLFQLLHSLHIHYYLKLVK
jgi:hypothetical protein